MNYYRASFEKRNMMRYASSSKFIINSASCADRFNSITNNQLTAWVYFAPPFLS